MMPKLRTLGLDKRDFEILADFRHRIRRFLRFSEEVTRQHGVTHLQYMLLLQLKGFPGRDWATVGELAERLQAQQHGVVALISRCEKLGFVVRRQSTEDRRRMEIHLLAKGEELIEKLARLHQDELLSQQGQFVVPDASAFDKE